jgi:hypothetical protein
MLQVTLTSLPNRMKLRLFGQWPYNTCIRTPHFKIVALCLDLVDLTMTNLNPMFIKDSRDFTDRFYHQPTIEMIAIRQI